MVGKFMTFVVPSALMCYFFPLIGIGLATPKFWVAFVFFALISETIRFGYFEEKLASETSLVSETYTKIFLVNIALTASLIALFGLFAR